MADKRITELTNITGANLADADEFVVVDSSASETKAITWAELKTGLDTSTGFVRVTGDTMTGNLTFGDNNKAIFGAGSDLQIYHSGSDSYIGDTGQGNLIIFGDTNVDIQNAAGIKMFRGESGGPAYLYHNNAIKLNTTSTGVDVTGTVTADALVVEAVSDALITVSDSSSANQKMELKHNAGVSTLLSGNNGAYGTIRIDQFNGTTTRQSVFVNSNNNVQFFEDTGTTAKLTWDASAEALGIGTSSPAYPLHVWSDTTIARFGGTDTGNTYLNFFKDSAATIIKVQASKAGTGATDLSINPDGGNLGIGTSSPAALLSLNANAPILKFTNPVATTGFDVGLVGGASSKNAYLIQREAAPLIFHTSDTERLRIDSSGNVGIGKSSPAIRLDIVAANNSQLRIDSSDANDTTFLLDYNGGGATNRIRIRNAAGALAFSVSNNVEAMRIDSSGRVGIGTSSPSSALTVRSTDATIRLEDSDLPSGAYGLLRAYDGGMSLEADASSVQSNSYIRFAVDNSERMRIDASGNVGIGVSPTNLLSLGKGISYNADSALFMDMGVNDTAVNNNATYNWRVGLTGNATGHSYTFSSLGRTQGSYTERLRIDSSGNLLVGTTSADPITVNTDGISLGSDKIYRSTVTGGPPIAVNRKGNDGSIISLHKDGSTVGSIGTFDGDIIIGTGDTGLNFLDASDTVIPWNISSNTVRPDAIDLGTNYHRFKDLYLSGGVYLGGTGAANKLDDYEEGVWTPTVSSGSITAVNAATYTKIGNKVSFQVDMALGGTRGAEAFQVGGLPFVNGSSRWTACPMYHGAPISTYQQVMAVVTQGASYLVFNGMGTNIPANQFSNYYIAIAGTYMTN